MTPQEVEAAVEALTLRLADEIETDIDRVHYEVALAKLQGRKRP